MAEPTKKNPWWEFVKANEKVVPGKTRKERFQALSQMWNHEKSRLVTVSPEYIESLHDANKMLKKRVEDLEMENKRLMERLSYFCDGPEDGD